MLSLMLTQVSEPGTLKSHGDSYAHERIDLDVSTLAG